MSRMDSTYSSSLRRSPAASCFLQFRDAFGDRIKATAIRCLPRGRGLRIDPATFAEKLLEHATWIVLERQRDRRALKDWAYVRTADVFFLRSKFERSELRLLTQSLRGQSGRLRCRRESCPSSAPRRS